MITNKIKSLRSTPDLKSKPKSSTQRFTPPFLNKNFSISTSLEQADLLIQSKAESMLQKTPQKSLSRIGSDPKLLTNHSYIKIRNVEPDCIENFIQSMNKFQTNRSRIVSLKQSQFSGSAVDLNLNSSSKKGKFTRKSPGFGQQGKKKKSIFIQQGYQQKELILKDRQIETLKQQLELTIKSLQSKNKKIQDYEKMYTNVKKQYQERINKLQKKYSQLNQTLLSKEKEIDQLQFQLKKLSLENQNLQNKLSQLLHEPSFCKEGEGSANVTSTCDNLCTLNELEDQIYQKNIEIYQLKKNIDKYEIKEHYMQIIHQQEIKKVRNQSDKKEMQNKSRYKDLLMKYQALESQIRIKRVIQSSESKNNAQTFQCKEQESLDLSLSFGF